MKKYKTIDLLYKIYNGEIFTNKFKNVETGEIIHQGNIYDKPDINNMFYNDEGVHFMKGINVYSMDSFLNEEWEEIKEPIEFKEAVEAYSNNKTIYCIHNCGDRHTYKPNGNHSFLDEYDRSITAAEILYWKWYIEE